MPTYTSTTKWIVWISAQRAKLCFQQPLDGQLTVVAYLDQSKIWVVYLEPGYFGGISGTDQIISGINGILSTLVTLPQSANKVLPQEFPPRRHRYGLSTCWYGGARGYTRIRVSLSIPGFFVKKKVNGDTVGYSGGICEPIRANWNNNTIQACTHWTADTNRQN